MAEQANGAAGGIAAPVADVINTIALTACQDSRHRICFTGGDGVRSLTLADLDRGAVKVACHLHALGVRPRDRIGIMSRNRIEWVLLDLPVLNLGAVTAGVRPRRTKPVQLVSDFGLRLLFAADGRTAGK